jgi:hypothetical protein
LPNSDASRRMPLRMGHERSIRRYRRWYARLLRLYPKPFYEQFGEGMEQTFNDLLRERAQNERRLLGTAVWMFVETSGGVIRVNASSGIRRKNLLRIAVATAAVLLVPLVAMQFTDEVDWDPGDFVVAGALLFGAGLAYELVARRAATGAYRLAAGLTVATALFLVWSNLAVGLIGDEGNRANLMYLGVLAVVVIGSFIARLRPQGMATALLVTALAQMVVGVVAVVAGWGAPRTLLVNGFFAALWVGSALVFRLAADPNLNRQPESPPNSWR